MESNLTSAVISLVDEGPDKHAHLLDARFVRLLS
ncbi:hypothetical protein C8D88_104329 [Lentzea atacamensis]|uniref:Uncharacterized protein n=1 Tax=Lentzea atacamensis TaxID=531938 RepID=A0A316I3U3_9PSEU|nr:hypothetical protein C8D88_104329 [Lentzea atacamensis]